MYPLWLITGPKGNYGYLFEGQKGTSMFPSSKRYIYVPFLLNVNVQYQETVCVKLNTKEVR